MFKRDTRFVPEITPAMIEAAHRNARSERSMAFHAFLGGIGDAFRARPKQQPASRFPVSGRASTGSC